MQNQAVGELLKLVIFVRLWQRVLQRCGECLLMTTLADICSVLHLFNTTNVNPDFSPSCRHLLMPKEV